MNPFPSAREAKEFLVARIVKEAKREGVALSEIERKMLYFSESYWTLPDMMEVSDQFDQEYDQDEYEKKIASLVRSATGRARKENPEEYDRWQDAVRLLNTEDHYILVMVGRGGISIPGSPSARPPHDQLKLLGTAVAIVLVILIAVFLSVRYSIDLTNYVPSRERLNADIWMALGSIVIAYGIFGLIFGTQRTNAMLTRILGKLFGFPERDK